MRQRDIFWFWLPLFASWLLMTAEGPIISAAINRQPNEVVMLAAQGIVISLAVLIESPIINLLATSTAVVQDRHSFLLVRRFTIHWMIGLTIVSVLVAYTPLFDLIVLRLLNTPAEIAQWVQLGLQIMVFWSAAIAWRRFLQGVMIHFGQTRKVAWGTLIRLIGSGGMVVVLAVWGALPGIAMAGVAWMTGVLAEALYATVAIRPLLNNELAADRPPADGDPLTYHELFWFHLPLALTSVLVLLAQPLVTFSLARLENPTQSLAAWPVLFQIMLMARAVALALPEVVIALSNGRSTFLPLRRFTYILTAAITLLMALFMFTPLASWYLFTVQDMDTAVGALTQSALAFFLFYPALAVITSWLRGLLIKQKVTSAVNGGMAINLAVTAVVLFIGLALRWEGLPTAALALNLASLAEVIYLALRTRRLLAFDLPLFGGWKLPPAVPSET